MSKTFRTGFGWANNTGLKIDLHGSGYFCEHQKYRLILILMIFVTIAWNSPVRSRMALVASFFFNIDHDCIFLSKLSVLITWDFPQLAKY